VTPHDTLLPLEEWVGGVPESECCQDGERDAVEGRHARRLLGRGSGDCGLHSEPCTHMQSKRKNPYEVWNGKKPSVHHLRNFGCVAYVKDTSPHLA
jgi:hypothetical protein